MREGRGTRTSRVTATTPLSEERAGSASALRCSAGPTGNWRQLQSDDRRNADHARASPSALPRLKVELPRAKKFCPGVRTVTGSAAGALTHLRGVLNLVTGIDAVLWEQEGYRQSVPDHDIVLPAESSTEPVGDCAGDERATHAGAPWPLASHGRGICHRVPNRVRVWHLSRSRKCAMSAPPFGTTSSVSPLENVTLDPECVSPVTVCGTGCFSAVHAGRTAPGSIGAATEITATGSSLTLEGVGTQAQRLRTTKILSGPHTLRILTTAKRWGRSRTPNETRARIRGVLPRLPAGRAHRRHPSRTVTALSVWKEIGERRAATSRIR